MSSSADRTGRADRTVGHESAALDEIELAGELMIAATASSAERLPTARIDEVLLHQQLAGTEQQAALPGQDGDDSEDEGEQVSSAAAD